MPRVVVGLFGLILALLLAGCGASTDEWSAVGGENPAFSESSAEVPATGDLETAAPLAPKRVEAGTETSRSSSESPSSDNATTSDEPTKAVVFNAMAVSFSYSDQSSLWEVSESSQKRLGLLVDEEGTAIQATDIELLQSGKYLVSTYDALYKISSTVAEDGNITAELMTRTENPGTNALAFDPDGSVLAAGKDGLVQVDMSSGDATQVLVYGQGIGSSGDITSDADGNYFATATWLTTQGHHDGSLGDLLLKLNPRTKTVETVSEKLPKDVDGLLFVEDRLIGFRAAPDKSDCEGQLINIDPATGKLEPIRCLPFAPGGAAYTAK